jgi:hypothetical protein
MKKHLQIRSLAHVLCPVYGAYGVMLDILINPHLYGEVVHWSSRSTVIASAALAIWLVAVAMTYWVQRRNS